MIAKLGPTRMALREKVFPGGCPLRKKQLRATDHTMRQPVGFISEGGNKQPISFYCFKTLERGSQLNEFYV